MLNNQFSFQYVQYSILVSGKHLYTAVVWMYLPTCSHVETSPLSYNHRQEHNLIVLFRSRMSKQRSGLNKLRKMESPPSVRRERAEETLMYTHIPCSAMWFPVPIEFAGKKAIIRCGPMAFSLLE